MDLLFPSSEHGLRRDVFAAAVQADGVLAIDATLDEPPPVIE
jgi:hypothetical protein